MRTGAIAYELINRGIVLNEIKSKYYDVCVDKDSEYGKALASQIDEAQTGISEIMLSIPHDQINDVLSSAQHYARIQDEELVDTFLSAIDTVKDCAFASEKAEQNTLI